MSLATPLVDGMVVSRRAVGPLLRQTALNMSRSALLQLFSYFLIVISCVFFIKIKSSFVPFA